MVDINKFLKPNTKIEMCYTDKLNNPKCFSSEILKIFDDKILIAFPNTDVFVEQPKSISSKFSLIISTENGVLSCNTNFIKEHEKGWYISFPYNTQFCQRRENLRTPIHIDFELITDKGNYRFTTKNLSGRGLAFVTDEEMKFNEAVINLILNENNILSLNCKKIYTKLLENFEKPAYMNGLYFHDINKNELDTIVKKCMSFQISAKQNENLFNNI